MQYEWHGFSYKVNAQVVGEEIERLEQKNGKVTPAEMVKEAKPKKSPLHNLFEWDDKKAADAYRLQTARQVLCALYVVNPDRPKERAFVNVELRAETRQGTFVNVNAAMTDEITRDIVLQNAISELKAFKNKYKRLSELAKVFEAIDSLE